MKEEEVGIKNKWKTLGKCILGPLVFTTVELPTLFPKPSSGRPMLVQFCLPTACLMRKLSAGFVLAANIWTSRYSLPIKTPKAESEDSSQHIQIGIPSLWQRLSETSYERHKNGWTGLWDLLLVLGMIMCGFFILLALYSFAYRMKKL